MSADDHGRTATYTNHLCRCLRCTEAWRLYNIQQRASRREQTAANGGIAPFWHHNRSTYHNWGCGCETCLADTRHYRRERKARA